MAEWPANGVTDWNTKSLAYLAVEHTTDGTHNAVGMVRQVVNTTTGAVSTGTTKIPVDNTIPQITEGDEYMTLAVTPKSATNKLKIEVVWNGAHSSTGTDMVIALFQDTTVSALAAAWASKYTGANNTAQVTLTHYMTSGTTSATTFRVRGGSSFTGTTTFNGKSSGRNFGGIMASSITITEIQV